MCSDSSDGLEQFPSKEKVAGSSPARSTILTTSQNSFIEKMKQWSSSCREKYNLNKNKCLSCGKEFPYEKRRNKFCNHSCAASFNNLGWSRNHKKSHRVCSFCGELLDKNEKKYCSYKCEWDDWCKTIDNMAEFFGYTWRSSSKRPKKYLIEKRGHKCEVCGQSEWCGKPVPLVFDHIDGNANNWKLSNCRLVCGNCDMQLPTYKSKNKNSVREYTNFRV